MKNTETKNKDIYSFCHKHAGRAIVIEWHSQEFDWFHFRAEGVNRGQILLSGTADDDGTKHDGSFFLCNPSEIKTVRLRIS